MFSDVSRIKIFNKEKFLILSAYIFLYLIAISGILLNLLYFIKTFMKLAVISWIPSCSFKVVDINTASLSENPEYLTNCLYWSMSNKLRKILIKISMIYFCLYPIKVMKVHSCKNIVFIFINMKNTVPRVYLKPIVSMLSYLMKLQFKKFELIVFL